LEESILKEIMKRLEVVTSLSELIHKEVPDAKIILFGSQARGDAQLKSDIDVLILLNKEKVTLEDEEKITVPIYLLELKTGVIISPMILPRNSWENRPIKSPFYLNVLNEGVEI
jgi:predicted nucleotidyltransferase